MGQIGSGKTSLLQTLLGELEILNGELHIGGKIAYVP